MSSGTDNAAVIAEYQDLLIDNITVAVVISLYFYEYLITFDREVRVIWGRRATGATAIFVLNRYLMFPQYIVNIPTYFPQTNQVIGYLSLELHILICYSSSCSVLIWIYRISNILPYCVWAVFSSLRAFAISGRNWQLASSVLLLLFVPIGVNIYFITLDRPLNLPAPIYCTDSSSVTVSTNFICSIVADALVLATTWFKTHEIIRAAAEARTRAYLGILLLRDGTVYFGVLLILNVIHMSLTLTDTFAESNLFLELFTSILISRFLLNLREVGLLGNDSLNTGRATFMRSQEFPQFDTIQFASTFIDPLGAPLDHGPSLETNTSSTFIRRHRNMELDEEPGDIVIVSRLGTSGVFPTHESSDTS